MKKVFYIFCVSIITLTACQDNDIRLFEKTAAERTAEAIAALKADLVEPSNGWRVKYRPTPATGSFYVLMDFNDDNTVILKTDLNSNGGEFFQDTITYRIDSAMGLELIMESYCFFSFLFEQDQATFGAEFEFNYANKTPDGELVFTSKTDIVDPTVLLFEEAEADDEDEFLGQTVSTNLSLIGDDLSNFTSSFKLTYDNKDVVLYLALDEFRRTIKFNSVSKKNNTQVTTVGFEVPYVIKGDSLVLDESLTQTFGGSTIKIKSIKFNNLTNSQINVCASPIDSHIYAGVTSANDAVKLEPTLVDVTGKQFATLTDFYAAGTTNVFHNGQNQAGQIAADLPTAVAVQLYYDYNGDGFYAIGFVLQNSDGSLTFALREFTPTLTDNKLVFNFQPGISLFGNTNPDDDVNAINTYIDGLTQGGNTYVFKFQEGLYEFYNPCTGWSIGFQAVL